MLSRTLPRQADSASPDRVVCHCDPARTPMQALAESHCRPALGSFSTVAIAVVSALALMPVARRGLSPCAASPSSARASRGSPPRANWPRTRRVTLFEAGNYFGGHTHTVDVTIDGATHGVDTGFLVFNERTYPNLIRLFDELQVETALSDMSFSVQAPGIGASGSLEWSGSDLNGVFAQRRNLLRPRFWGMLRDLLRFNRLCTGLAERNVESELVQPIGDFLAEHRFSHEFRDWYFLPMIGCIWSCPTDQMLRFPIATMIRFCHNHGLLQLANRPRWFTVRGGARNYVEKIVAGSPTPVSRHLCEAFAGCRRPGREQGAAAPGCWSPPTRAANASTSSCSPVIATSHSRCWPTPRSTSAACSARSTTTATAPCCTPTPRCCRAAGAPGPRGTTSARPRTARAGGGLSALPAEQASATAVREAIDGVAQPTWSSRGAVRCSASSTTRIRCSICGPSPRSSACRRCKARRGRGSAAPGRVTASTRTD